MFGSMVLRKVDNLEVEFRKDIILKVTYFGATVYAEALYMQLLLFLI